MNIPTHRIGLTFGVATALFLGALGAGTGRAAARVCLAEGAHAGEVTTDSAIVWTRLTQHPERNLTGVPFVKVRPEELPPLHLPPGLSAYEANALRVSQPVPEAPQLGGHALSEMEGAVPGAAGEACIVYWPASEPEATAVHTPRIAAGPDTDFTCQFRLSGLKPGQRYRFRAESYRPGEPAPDSVFAGGFTTAPLPGDPARISFTVVTCQDYTRRDDPANGHRIYAEMLKLHPDFFVHTGDLEYMDKPTPLATNAELACFKFDRILALPFQRAFFGQVSTCFMKDDHDTLKDDAWPGQSYGDLTWAEGIRIFREHVPTGDKPYRTFRWGRDLQVWLVEGREYRSPNPQPDGPGKTIWGAEQKRWFMDTVRASDATFRILITPTPLLGPDRDGKGDNYANAAFAHEGAELRAFVAAQKNMIVLTGDRHWQYASTDPASGLREYCPGPSSDEHAGGFSEADRTPAHRFLRIKGGFLSLVVERINGVPHEIIRHYGTDGKIYHEDVLPAAR